MAQIYTAQEVMPELEDVVKILTAKLSYEAAQNRPDKDTWNKVQKRLNSHESPTKTGEIHYFSGKVYCEECNKIFTRNKCNVKSEPNGKRVYLQCKGAKKYHICDNNKSMRMDELEQLLLDKINELLDNFYDYNDLETNYQNRKSNNNTKDNEIQILEKEKKNLEKKINENKVYYRKLYEDNVKGLITEDMFKMLSKDYLNEIDSMTKRINIIDEDMQRLVDLQEFVKEIEKVYNELLSTGHKKVTMKLYDRMRHEILNEFGKEEVMVNVAQWCQKILSI